MMTYESMKFWASTEGENEVIKKEERIEGWKRRIRWFNDLIQKEDMEILKCKNKIQYAKENIKKETARMNFRIKNAKRLKTIENLKRRLEELGA